MIFPGTGFADDAWQVLGRDSGARHDYDILLGSANQLGDQLHTLEHGRFLTGGEQAVDVQLDQFVETAKRVGSDVERAVKGNFQRVRQLDQLPGSLGIDRAVGVEHADHHAVDAGLL